jgi:hypothetical protein
MRVRECVELIYSIGWLLIRTKEGRSFSLLMLIIIGIVDGISSREYGKPNIAISVTSVYGECVGRVEKHYSTARKGTVFKLPREHCWNLEEGEKRKGYLNWNDLRGYSYKDTTSLGLPKYREDEVRDAGRIISIYPSYVNLDTGDQYRRMKHIGRRCIGRRAIVNLREVLVDCK